MVICLEQDADLHTAPLLPLPLTVSCFSKIQIGLPFWYRLTSVVPDKGPLNGCVCVCVCVCADMCSAIAAGIRGGVFKLSMARLNIRIRNYLFASLAQQEIGFFDVTKTG